MFGFETKRELRDRLAEVEKRESSYTNSIIALIAAGASGQSTALPTATALFIPDRALSDKAWRRLNSYQLKTRLVDGDTFTDGELQLKTDGRGGDRPDVICRDLGPNQALTLLLCLEHHFPKLKQWIPVSNR